MKADVLVVDSHPLSFDLPTGMDVIKMLDGVSINKSYEAIFSRTNIYVYTVIKIAESVLNLMT